MIKNLLLFLCLASFSSLSAQTYVNQAATGANDGSSWADAYTSLTEALANTASGDIWVAQGLYLPEATEGSFNITSQVNLYGAFAGTETSIGQRDFSNTSQLSGDLEQDDQDDNFFDNREDNALHVVYVDSLLDAVTIDGFLISNGNTVDDPDVDYIQRVGGGVFSYSTLNVANCLFLNNFGRSGGALAITEYNGGGNGSTISGCSFQRNRTTSQSAGVFLNTLNDVSITDCEFVENIVLRGALYPLLCNGLTIERCSFRDNFPEVAGFGGAFFAWQPNDLLVFQCEFVNNSTGNGAVMYIDGREAETAADNVLFSECLFEGNNASASAGAVRSFAISYTLQNCVFENNVAGANGGSILANGPDTVAFEVVVDNCSFTNEIGNFGGSMALYSLASTYTITNSSFEDNNALTTGSSVFAAFGANVTLDNVTILQDTARFGAGCGLQTTGTTMTINNTLFENGVATDNSGAINVFEAVDLTVTNSTFTLNNAGVNGGILSTTINNDTIPVPGNLTFENCFFESNSSGANPGVVAQGGVFNIINYDLNLTNNVFAFNNNFGDGFGGVMSLNSASGYNLNTNLVNNTFYGNFSNQGVVIGGYTDPDNPASTLDINMQNNVFMNEDGDDYEIEAGTPAVNTTGGNLSTDNSFEDVLVGTNDAVGVDDIEFVDPDDLDFKLNSISPAIDNGIAAGAPDLDFRGKARIGNHDSGAFEFDPTEFVTEEVIENIGALKLITNPVGNELNYELTNDWNGNLQLSIMDIQGRLHVSQDIFKNADNQRFMQNVEQLTGGVYIVFVSNGQQAIMTKMVKR